MANKKISELPYINVSKISGNTLVPLVTYFSAATGDTVHTYANDLKTFITSGLTGQTDVFVTGGTYSAGTITLTNNTGGTFNITGLTTTVSGNYLPLSGGTVSGGTQFTVGLTATTISATTYQNLPTDIRVTGGTYSAGTISFTNNTGGTFSVTGLTTGSTSTVSGNFLPLSGGTVTGNTSFTSGLTINYIDFDTTPTVPNPTGGTLYYDSTENALSYKPITPSNDVTVNLGQESLIRIYNNSGVQINNGQALHITGATSGSPTVSLAIGAGGNNTQFQISGIATHDIPNSSFGFMAVFGVVRDLNLTAFTVGEQIYLSQTVPGGLSSYSGLSITGRTCEVGHILDNSASGKLQVAILNEIEGTIITTQENNILAANNSSTGIFEFSGLSISTPSGTTFNVGPVDGWIIDNVTSPTNPTIQLITYPGSTGNTALYVSSATETYILLTSGLTLTQQTTFPTPQQRRQNLYLGKFGHANRQYLINAFNEPDSSLSPVSQLRDMFTPIRLINEGVIVSANGANLNINTSAGVLYGLGIGYITNKLNPNSLSVSGTSPCTFQYRTQTGGTASNTTLITPGVYDNNGVVTSVGGGSNSSTNQRIYLVQNGQFRIQYGQQVYGSLTEAIEASQNEAFTTFSNFRDNATLIGILSVNKNATNLSDTTQARFLLTSKFGETVGAAGGVSTTNLQQAYNNSTTPEITTNSSLGPLSVKNGAGTADNITNVFEGVDSGGTTTSYVRADGFISGSTISTPSFTANTNGVTTTTLSATTYQNLPDNVTGNYLPLSGGTVTGLTYFTSGLTITGDTIIIDSTGNATALDTSTRELVDTASLVSLDWSNRVLMDSVGVNSTDWGNRWLIDSGGTISVDWQTGTLNDVTTGNPTLNWNSRFLYDSSGTNTVNWESGLLYDYAGQTSVDWNQRILQDQNGYQSIDYITRYLIKSDGNTISFDWENGILTGQTNIESSTISATTYQNLPSFSGGSGNCITDLYVTNVYGCSPITLQSSLQNSQTISTGDLSHSEGFGSETAINNAYYAQSVSSGLITLSSTYGDVTGEFYAEDLLLLYDIPFDYNYGSIITTISASTFNGVETEIQLQDINITTTTAYVGDITFGISSWTGDQTIPGHYSHAEGYATFSMGQFSHAEGNGTYAIGEISHTEGYRSVSIGEGSHSEGGSTQSIGTYSHSEGTSTQSIGFASHSEGNNTKSIGESSHSEGRGTSSIGTSSHSEGISTKSGYKGYQTSTPITSGVFEIDTSYGDLTSLFATGSFIIFQDNSAEINAGVYTTYLYEVASSTYNGTPATEITLVDTSINTITPNSPVGIYNSHDPLLSDQSIGAYSHSEGTATQAIGEFSHSEGEETVSLGWGQTVVGRFNDPISTPSAFIVGDGENDTKRHNLLVASNSGVTISGTLSATTYLNLPTSNVTGDYLPLSGGTVTGNTIFTQNISVTGGTGINWFSGNTSTDLLRVTQTGTGNAFVVEDSTNPDNTPFVINSGGSVSIGSTGVFSVGGSAETKLNVSNGSSGLATTGLSVSTPLIVESSLTTSIGMISPDNQLSQIYFGTPSDALGSVLRWDYTKKDFSLGTSTTGGKLIFLTGTYDEVARIDQNGNMGIGLTGATQKFEVSGNSRIIGTLSANTISATTYQNLPNSLTGLYLPTSGGTVSGNTIFTSGLTASTTTINGNLTVTGNTNVRSFTGTTGYISGSGQSILTVIGSGNSTTSPLFTVQGSSGELFSINDSLVGSLFSVNDISGLPILEVFSDNTTLMGSYQAPSLNTTTKVTLTAGTNTVYSIPTSAYTGAFIDYTLVSTGTTGARAGNIMTIWSGSTAQYTETSTNDIGNTAGVTFSVAVSGNNAVLSSSATTTGWTLKTIIRSI